MRIAQIAPLVESVPPRLYGGTERAVHYLTEELVAQGHDVTLFASGDSETDGRLVPCSGEALRMDPNANFDLPHHVLMLERVWQRAQLFDILHFHIDYLHFPLFRSISGRTVTTMHGRLDLPDLHPLFSEFSDMPLVSISNSQRAPFPPVRWMGTVYHGLPPDRYKFYPAAGQSYLAFFGRIAPEKRPDLAIRIAKRSGRKLRIAAKVDAVDRTYFCEQIAPLLEDPSVEYVGEIDDADKGAFLGNAAALLFPIDWPEPFGLTMIEAMSAGTPVIALDRGSVPEIMVDGVSGFIVQSVDEAVAAVDRVSSLDRRSVRRYFEERFTVSRMADDYLAIYRSLIEPQPLTAEAA